MKLSKLKQWKPPSNWVRHKSKCAKMKKGINNATSTKRAMDGQSCD